MEFDVKIEAGDLYDYMLMHSYHGASGLLGSGVGAVMLLVGAARSQWIFVIFGIVLLLYLPCALFLKSRQQVLGNPAFKQPLHYVLDEEGITVSQGEASQSQAWGDMVKAVSTGRSIIIYTSKVNATIFPRKQLGEDINGLIAHICAHMPPKRVKIRC